MKRSALKLEVSEEGIAKTGIIRETRTLTKEEVLKNKVRVCEAKFKELMGLHTLGCFKRYPRSKSRNRVDTRWVITWKWVDGVLIIKCRFTERGFKDRD